MAIDSLRPQVIMPLYSLGLIVLVSTAKLQIVHVHGDVKSPVGYLQDCAGFDDAEVISSIGSTLGPYEKQ